MSGALVGMSGTTGRTLDGLAHLRQSIVDILTTPLGSRVMLSDYGSRLFALVDQPTSGLTLLALYAAVAEALQRWEPRFKLNRIQHQVNADGRVVLTLSGEYRPEGRSITLDGVIL